jgi:hypothetical protein
MRNGRPWKLKAFIGGIYGTVADTRSFATEAAAERAATAMHRLGWTTRVWRQSGS